MGSIYLVAAFWETRPTMKFAIIAVVMAVFATEACSQATSDEAYLMETGGQLLKTVLSYGDYVIAALPDPAAAAQVAHDNTQLAKDALVLVKDVFNRVQNMPNML